jgi:hypothetical protein
MPTPTPKLPLPPTSSRLLDAVSSSAAKSAQINTTISKAAADLAKARKANTGSGAGTGSGAALGSAL